MTSAPVPLRGMKRARCSSSTHGMRNASVLPEPAEAPPPRVRPCAPADGAVHRRCRPPAVPALLQWHSRQGARQGGAGCVGAPVLAAPSTSRPASRCGIVRAWTSVISLKPCASTAACVGALSSRPANSDALMMPLTRASTRSGTTTSAPFFFCGAMAFWSARSAAWQVYRSHSVTHRQSSWLIQGCISFMTVHVQVQVQGWGAPSSAGAPSCRLRPRPALRHRAPAPRRPRPARLRRALHPLAPPAWPRCRPPPAGTTTLREPLAPSECRSTAEPATQAPPALVPRPRSAFSCASALAAALPAPELPALQHRQCVETRESDKAAERGNHATGPAPGGSTSGCAAAFLFPFFCLCASSAGMAASRQTDFAYTPECASTPLSVAHADARL